VKTYVAPEGRVCKQRDFVYERLREIPGVTVTKPRAGFYIFPRLDPDRFHITDDEQFALDLLRDEHVLIVHGKGFNWETPGYFRIVYLPRRAVLGEALDGIEHFLSYYRQ
jgi:alanine-synthesizing transaminase